MRKGESHKGENGRVLIIGGSRDYFGAPILSALGAMNSGSDLVYLLVPEVNFQVTRSYYPDLIVRSYEGEYLNTNAVEMVRELGAKVDCILIGPGVSESPEINQSISKIIEMVLTEFPRVKLVLDAEAIAAISHIAHTLPLPANVGERIIITPNAHELKEMIPEEIPASIEGRVVLAQQYAQNWGVTVLLKGMVDIIAAKNGEYMLNETGNAGMTVGGTGDVLAGVTASFIAQHCGLVEAAEAAAFCVGASGDSLEKTKGFAYTATDVALELPYILRSL